mgnify:CR=1 FL=1
MEDKMEVEIKTEYIKLDQLLKYSGLVDTGSGAKDLILDGYVKVDGEIETRRGRKIYKGYVVTFENEEITVD